MADTYTPRGRLIKPEYAAYEDAWGTVINDGTFELADDMWGVEAPITVSGNVTLTSVNGLDDQARKFVLFFTGAGGFTVTSPAVDKPYFIVNDCAAAITFKPSGGTGVSIRAGARVFYWTNSAATIGYAYDPTLDQIKAATADVSMGGFKLTNVADPTSGQHAATKAYADALTFTSALPGATGVATAAQARAGTTGKIFDAEVAYSAVAPVALTDGATITPDFQAGRVFTVTLGGNRAMANATNQVAGQSGLFFITQDGTGSRTLSWGSNYKFPGGAPTLTTTAAGLDIIAYYVSASGTIVCTFNGAFA